MLEQLNEVPEKVSAALVSPKVIKFDEVLLETLAKIFISIAIIVLAKFAVWVGCKLIKFVMQRNKEIDKAKSIAKFSTMFCTVYKYTVYIIAIVTVFSKIFNFFDLKSVLATVGIGGVALGFGAQSLVKDIISGFFVLLENQMQPGDLVTIGSITGTVTDVDLRCVKLLTSKGETVFIPYGEIRELINKSKAHTAILIDIPVSYDEDVNAVLKLAKDIADNFDDPNLTKKIEALAPIGFDDKFYKIRLSGKCIPCTNWAIERELRRRVIEKANEMNLKLGINLEIK